MASFIAALAQIAALVRKELLALINEPASRVILIAPAFLQALMYGYGATYDLTHVPYAVLDQSRSAASIELLARLDGTGVFVRKPHSHHRGRSRSGRCGKGLDGTEHTVGL